MMISKPDSAMKYAMYNVKAKPNVPHVGAACGMTGDLKFQD